ncbi:MAG: tetratricopeptide repeat protein [Persicimonas sp.]
MDKMEQSLIAFPALRRLQALLPRGLDSAPEVVLRALEKEDYTRALKEANTRYANRGVDDEIAVLTYACLLVGRELVVEARSLLDKAMEVHGRKPNLMALLGDALVLEGDLERARETLAEIDPEAIERASVAGFVADVLLDLGAEDEAVAFYQLAIDRQTDDVESAIRLGQLRMGRDELRQAAEAFEYAARLAKKRRGLWRTTRDLWFELGEEFAGYRAQQRLLELEGGELEDWLDLGLGLAAHASYEEALDALRTAEEYDPFDPDPLVARGHVLLEMGRAEEAIAAFDKLTKLVGERAAAHRGVASAALMIGDLELARQRAQRAADLEPADAEALHTLGVVLQQWGRHAKALAEIDRAIELDGERAAYHQSRALSLAPLGRDDEATEAMLRAVEMSAHGFEGVADLALELVKRAKFDEARTLIDNVHSEAATFKLIYELIGFVLGVFEDRDGRAEEAEDRLVELAAAHPEWLPVELDYQGWLRLGRSMDDPTGERLEALLAALQGRLAE